MEENNTKNFDAFLRKAIKEVGLEEPSKDFNKAILSKLSLKREYQIVKNKPLIANFGWLIIFIGTILLVSSVLFYGQESKVDGKYLILFDKLMNVNFLNKILKLTVSEIFMYSTVGLLIFLYIQIFVLKRYMNNDYSL